MAVRTGIAALAIAIAGCAEDVCRGSEAKYYNEALAFHLAKRGVPHKISANVVCVSARNTAGLRAAEADVDATFPQVAYLLKDSCEERAFAGWARREGLRFDIRSTVDSQNEPSGRMFLLRSFTREEVASNRAKLANDAPKKATCKAPT
jgi:NAD(P)-dependent dehydrogenase (short-subunit alcohol dehydrogenase family)